MRITQSVIHGEENPVGIEGKGKRDEGFFPIFSL